MNTNDLELTPQTPLEVGDGAPDLTLSNHEGHAIALATLWRSQPRVLLFVRHFGWPMCREHVVDVRNDYQRFLDAHGDVAVITMGTVEQTAAFRDRNRLPFICLADPERIAYQAYRVPRGSVLQVAGLAVWAGGLKAVLRAGIGKPVGDVLQLQASFIVDRRGIVRFVHLPKHSADRPTNEELIAQLHNLAGGNIVDGDEHR